jgi:hypothetical protein
MIRKNLSLWLERAIAGRLRKRRKLIEKRLSSETTATRAQMKQQKEASRHAAPERVPTFGTVSPKQIVKPRAFSPKQLPLRIDMENSSYWAVNLGVSRRCFSH